MKNFLPLCAADMLPLRLALQRHPELWDQHVYRTTFHGTPFQGMSDILLRYSRPEKLETRDAEAMVSDLDLVLYPAWTVLSECHETVFNLMRRFNGISLGRVIIARLPPGGQILPHADDYGAYALQQDVLRLHVCVQGLPGCVFHCGDETVQMPTDSVWWFNHREMHSAENRSADDRIHLLLDIQTG